MQLVTPRGQGLVEYAMIILLVGLAVIITLSIFGTGVGNMFSQIVSGIWDRLGCVPHHACMRPAGHPGGSSRGLLSRFPAPSAGVGLSGLGPRVSCRTPPHGQLDASREFAPREQHLPPASQALDPDVGAQAHDYPVRASARMRLSQAEDILHLKIG
jgi:Flp pilus assembly pilin Flp